MAGTGHIDRFQFRLNAADPRERELYETLIALPPGKRNAYIVQKLLAPGGEGIDAETLRTAVREAVTDALRAGYDPVAAMDDGRHTANASGAAGLPQDLLDTSIF